MTNGTRNWDEWASRYKETIMAQKASGSLISYEWSFAANVLRHVPGLVPSSVTPQTPFVGENGQILHMDFGIEINGHKIALEIEGYDKDGSGMGKSKSDHNNFMSRQRALESQGWRLVSFTNQDHQRDPAGCQVRIQQAISVAQPISVHVNVQQPQAQARKAEGRGRDRGSASMLIGLGLVAVGVLAAVIFANSQSGTAPTFRNPSNPDCFEFSSRAELNSWAAQNVSIVDQANLDGDGDGLICESFNYPDD
jgi:hypothetical protein